MDLGRIICEIGKEVGKDMVAKEKGAEAVKRRQQLKKEQAATGMTICVGILVWTIIIVIFLANI